MGIRIGVMGAGAVGCYVGGKLLAQGGADLVFVGRERGRAEIAEHGLAVADFSADEIRIAPDKVRYQIDLGALAECDAVLVTVKSGQTAQVAQALAGVVSADATVVSLQNGVGNSAVLATHLPGRNIVPGIVTFNVVAKGRGLFHRATGGPLMLGATAPAGLQAAFDKSVGVEVHQDLEPHQWTKLLVNLSNSVSAMSGAPTRDLILSPAYRRIMGALVAEGVSVLKAAGIAPAKLRGIPIGLMPVIMRLPTPLVRMVARAQIRVDPQARSSMWQDLDRGRLTEVDFLNGEIVNLAERHRVAAVLNRRMVELVHQAEGLGASPGVSAAELWDSLHS